VLGSLVMAVYRDEVAPALPLLPEQVRGTAAESVAGAYAVAAQIGAPELIAAADDAFLAAMHAAATSSGIIALVSVLVVLRWLPGRGRRRAPAARPDPQLAASRTLG